ncbi:hypothetical protein P280DRAFT_432580 [Massarina eburnea CBS 473.64]|uniref:Exocyst complex component Sec8 n=1 Tax=Massarina eburnea CBS 473.64 TaxID=1395130 RepID=A0A6A6RR66_9PLEO|nr:hypothetical protein P280DRAFT_432580 [Massarina eburnea CBS 473.64]
MSRRPNGGGYANGGGYGGFGPVDDDYGRRPSAERRRPPRPGGYGGFVEREEAPAVQRPISIERSHARRKSRVEDAAARFGAGSGGQKMEEILQTIQQSFDYMTNEKCVPIEVALKLMDASSLGLASQYEKFKETHQDLQRALKTIVNEHHQGFNSSIGTFHKIQSSLQQSQHRVRTLKESLTQAKSHLSTTKPELKDFATSSQEYDEMIQMLNTIEQLQLVPDKLEARISEKRFMTAVDILQDALRMIRKSEMETIGALSDLRIYLSNQEHSLTDILIEELHNHLYLKSPYCEDRWKQYAQNQSKGDMSERARTDVRGRLLYHFLDSLDTSEPMTDDTPRNPEADTFQYIQLIIESLNKMNRLDLAIETIEQRLPVELFKVVDKSNNEVAQRHPSLLRAFSQKKDRKSVIGAASDDLRKGLLNDLLWTLYARFEAIAESHRVVHDVVAGIVKREGVRGSSSAALLRGFKELWKLYQSEMRSLLHDYLATDGDLAYRGGQGQKPNSSVFSRQPRDKNTRMFKLSDMDTKSSELTGEREKLESILRASVPGLISDSKRPEDEVSIHTNNTLDGSATGHKLLVEPSVFNMGILLPPSLDFLNRLKEVVPPNSDIVLSTLTSFLDDFLVNVFHPQLEETLIELCSHIFVDTDAFSEDPNWAQHSKKPIFKGAAKFFSLITAFCKMLDNLPHDQAFSQLIITQMSTYAKKCAGSFKQLIQRTQQKETTERHDKTPGVYAGVGNPIGDTIIKLFQAEPDEASDLVEQEISLLLVEVERDPPDQQDMIQDKKSLQSLCLLYTSMKWLATKVAQLRYISDRATDSTQVGKKNHRVTRRWTLLTSAEPRAEGVAVYLPLNLDTAGEFDNVLESYTSLSTLSHRTLHLTLRLTLLSTLSGTIKPTYVLETPLSDPDPTIQTLTTFLTAFDTHVSTYLPPSQYALITSGLSALTDAYMLLLCSSNITAMNANGCALMQLNILVLQQNLLNVEAEAKLEYSAMFFDLFTAGPHAMVARAKEKGKWYGIPGNRFGEEQVKGMLELWYGEKLRDERREVGVQAKRQMDGHLLELSEFMY